MLAHCRITALMVFGFLLLNAASDARAALNWINVSPGGNYTVIGMLNIGGNVTSSGLTPTVTTVKITLTENSSGNKLLLNVEAT